MPKFKLIKEVYNNLIFPDGTPPLFIAAAVLIGILISPLLVVAGIGFGIYTLVNFIKNGGRVSDDESNSEEAFKKLEDDTNQVSNAYSKLYPAMRYLPGSGNLPGPDELELRSKQTITAAKLTDNLSHDAQVKAAGAQLSNNAYTYFSRQLKEYRTALSTLGQVTGQALKQAVSSDSLRANEHLNAAQGFFASKELPIDSILQEKMNDINTENYIEKINLLKIGIQGGTGLADEYWNTFYGGWKLVEENGEQRLHLGGDYVGPENKGLFQHMQELEYLASEEKKREESEELTGEDLVKKKKNDELARKTYLKFVRFNAKHELKKLKQKASDQAERLERETFDPGEDIPVLNNRISEKRALIEKMELKISQETSKGPENRNSELVEQLTTRIQFQSDKIGRMQNEINVLRKLDKLRSSLGVNQETEVEALSSTIKGLIEQKKVMNVDLKKQKDALNKNYGRGWKSKITEEEKRTLVAKKAEISTLDTQIKYIKQTYKQKKKDLSKLEKQLQKDQSKGARSQEPKSQVKRLELTAERKDTLRHMLETQIQSLDKLLEQININEEQSHKLYTQLKGFFTEESIESFNQSLQQINLIGNELGYTQDSIISEFMDPSLSVEGLAKKFDAFVRKDSLELRREVLIDKIKESMKNFRMMAYTDKIGIEESANRKSNG